MELFSANGHLSDEGLDALMANSLDELGRLEAAEHLAYCDCCLDRYTARLTADAVQQPPHSVKGAVMGTIWVRIMQNTWGRAAVAGVAAVLALTMWRSGVLEQVLNSGDQLQALLPNVQTEQREPDAASSEPERLGKPAEDAHSRPQRLHWTLQDTFGGLLTGGEDASSPDGTAASKS